MKKIFLIISGCFFAFASNAQTATSSVFGTFTNSENIVKVDKLEASLNNNKFEGSVSGKVVEVCQSMGCWFKLEKADGTTMMVKVVDHGFAVPKDMAGKTIIAVGNASVKEISQKDRKHYAKDAGQSKKDIAKIKGSSKEIMFMTNGVKIVD